MTARPGAGRVCQQHAAVTLTSRAFAGEPWVWRAARLQLVRVASFRLRGVRSIFGATDQVETALSRGVVGDRGDVIRVSDVDLVNSESGAYRCIRALIPVRMLR